MQPLLHIGYHKTGTTWLQTRIFPRTKTGFCQVARSKTLVPAFVQVNPFSFEPEAVRKDFEPGIREARARNLVPVLSSERLSGNPHSGGYDSKNIADRLAAVFPDARVLVVIREQTSMLVSIYKQYVKAGGAAPFRRYITVPPAGPRMPLFRFDFLEYHRLVGYYQDLFGVTNVLVLPYELLQTQPQTFLERIGEFGGVPVARARLRPKAVSLSALTLSFKRHANRYVVWDTLNPGAPLAFDESNEHLKRLCNKVDRKLPVALRHLYERRWRRFAEREVGTRYAESNSLTAKLTGLDLRTLGYTCE